MKHAESKWRTLTDQNLSHKRKNSWSASHRRNEYSVIWKKYISENLHKCFVFLCWQCYFFSKIITSLATLQIRDKIKSCIFVCICMLKLWCTTALIKELDFASKIKTYKFIKSWGIWMLRGGSSFQLKLLCL